MTIDEAMWIKIDEYPNYRIYGGSDEAGIVIETEPVYVRKS
jgi:hypothetical protein